MGKMIRTIGYSIKQGFINLVKNRLLTLASIGTVASCLFILGLFYTILTNFQFMVNQLEDTIGLMVFFDENIELEEIEFIESEIKVRPELKSIRYISPEEAWENFKQQFEDQPGILEGFDDDNPLEQSASFEIYLDDLGKQEEFVRYVESIPGVRLVRRSQEAADIIKGFNRFIAYISLIIIIILLVVALFLISNTIRIGITIRKEEIRIMKLIGATDGFIRRPFVIEGMLIGLIGAAIPLGFIYFFYTRVIVYIQNMFGLLKDFLTFVQPNEIFSTLVPLCLGIGIGIGLLGSRLTLHKHLKV
jgi:cell division transport system permease protein